MKNLIRFAILVAACGCSERHEISSCIDETCMQICADRECGPSLYNAEYSCGECRNGRDCVEGRCILPGEDVNEYKDIPLDGRIGDAISDGSGTDENGARDTGGDTATVDAADTIETDQGGRDAGDDLPDMTVADTGSDSGCVKNCEGLKCGPDPVCGESCGECTGRDKCISGKCECQPYTDRECGENGCGGTIGECPSDGQKCVLGHCVNNPTDGMVSIAGATFSMGCDADVVNTCEADEKPVHEIILSAYEIDRTEVTQAEYARCVTAGDCDTPACGYSPARSGTKPVVCVTWRDARAYCAWAGKRLPTEAEWEYAARGDDGRIYPWGPNDPSCTYANMYSGGQAGCGTNATAAVCSKSPKGDSPFGLCDMAGNVWEWVFDYYDSGYYKSSPKNDPQGPASGISGHVIRGGAYDAEIVVVTPQVDLRSNNRKNIGMDSGLTTNVGFRCAR